MRCTEWTPKLSWVCFTICLRTLRTVSAFIMSYPVSRVSRFACNPAAVAASKVVIRGLQQISQRSSSSLLDVAADSTTCEDEASDALADEDGDEAKRDATGDEAERDIA